MGQRDTIELNEQQIISLMRQEWQGRALRLEKSIRTFMKTPEGEKLILGVGTKVKHAGSGLLYTISAIDRGKNLVFLQTPDGQEFGVPGTEFDGKDAEYVIS